MKLKASYRYIINDYMKAMLVYASVITVVSLLIFLFEAVWFKGVGTTRIGGMEFGSAIFMFIIGLNSFKEHYHMLTQNSVSRKGLFSATILSFITLAGLMSVFSVLIISLTKFMSQFQSSIESAGFFEELYSSHTFGMNQVGLVAETLLFSFVMFLAVLAIGYFITTMFYRLNKPAKIAVGVGVPVTLVMILPMVDAIVFGGKITISFVRFIDTIFGLTSQNPYVAVVSFVGIFIIAVALTWLLIRRANVKA